MTLCMRKYGSEDDYWRIRAFLRTVYQLNAGREHSWDVCRFDYWFWHVMPNCEEKAVDDFLYLWEDEAGQIAAVLSPDGMHEAFFHVHPAFRSPALEEAMLDTAEACLLLGGAAGTRKFNVWAQETDLARQALFQRRGYQKGDWPEFQRRRSMVGPVPEHAPAEGYTVRALGEHGELPARSWLSWKAFHPDEPDEKYRGWEWYRNVQRAPLYRRDLDLVAVAPDGELAAFCTVWYDDANRMGIFEPVGTHPNHQRRGLGRAVMSEGLRRLQRMGARTAHVGSYSEAAGALYAAMGFTEYELCERWIKML